MRSARSPPFGWAPILKPIILSLPCIGRLIMEWGRGCWQRLNLSVYAKNIKVVVFYERAQFTIQRKNRDEDTENWNIGWYGRKESKNGNK